MKKNLTELVFILSMRELYGTVSKSVSVYDTSAE